MTGACSTGDCCAGAEDVFGVAGALVEIFLVFTAAAGVGLAGAFLAGFAAFVAVDLVAGFAVDLTAFVEVAFTLSAVDELVFFAGIEPHLWVSISHLQNKSSKKSESV